MDDNFSPRVKDVISFSKEEALRLGHDHIGTEHLVLGMLRDGGGKAITILNAIDIDLDNLRKKVEILNSKKLRKKLIEYRKFIKDNFENVGDNFAYEARSIHYNSKKKEKGIYGIASNNELKELKEEGIQTEVIPWIEDKNN